MHVSLHMFAYSCPLFLLVLSHILSCSPKTVYLTGSLDVTIIFVQVMQCYTIDQSSALYNYYSETSNFAKIDLHTATFLGPT